MNRTFAAPGHYVQGRRTLDEIGSYAEKCGENALIVAHDEVWDIVCEDVTRSFEAVDCSFARSPFGGECTIEEIERLSEVVRDVNADLVVGIGGGKTIDTAKAVRERTSTALGSVPTIASTDAPTSSLSIVYTDGGAFESVEQYRKHPDFVLVDTALIAEAPVRWFSSGIGDALATCYEAKTVWESGGTTVFGDRPTYAGRALARTCHDVLLDHAESAVVAVEADMVTESVEAVTEAIILLSGLGFENGGLAAAHAIHDGLTTVSKRSDATHGEKVTVGLLAQLVLEGEPYERIADVARFATGVGLPVTLTGLGLEEISREELLSVGRVACAAERPMKNEPRDFTPEEVADALQAADALGAHLAP